MFVLSISVIELSQRFGVCRSPDALTEEYQDYQLSPESELPKFVIEDTRLDTFSFVHYKWRLNNRYCIKKEKNIYMFDLIMVLYVPVSNF